MCTLGLVSPSNAQIAGGGGGGMMGVPGTPFGGITDPSMVLVTAGFRIIPSIMVGQRYDSNVFYAPKNLGLNGEDFVSTVVPQVRGIYVGDLVAVGATVGVIGEYYAKNTELNYVGTNPSVFLDLSKLLSQWREGSRLMVVDNYRYTPNPQAFLPGDVSGEAMNPYVRGFQAGRVNSQTNFFSANLTVPLNQVVSLIGGYGSGFMKFGESDVTQEGALLNTSFQTYRAGLSRTMTPQDTVSLNFLGSQYDYDVSGGYTARGGTVGWIHLFRPNVTLTSEAGVQQIEGSSGGVGLPSTIGPVGNISLNLTDRTTMILLAYSVGITPSFQFQPQPLLTQLGTVTLTQRTGVTDLLAVASANYGRGNEYGSTSTSTGTSGFSYVSWGGNAGLIYQVTSKAFLGLTYSYSDYETSFGNEGFSFVRQIVQLNLTQAFY
jgi:hypothetical protein